MRSRGGVCPAVRAPSRDSHRRCALFVDCRQRVGFMHRVAVNSGRALVYDIVRYLGATIIVGLPHPRSISRYRLIDENPTNLHQSFVRGAL